MGDNVCYAMKRVIGERGKERNGILPATVCAASYGRECPVIKERVGMNGMLRRVSERRVEGSGVDRCPMARASRKSDESKQKETQGNVRLKVQ